MTGRCGHILCGRSAIERELDDAECQLSDCPYRASPAVAKDDDDLSPLARAIKEARGGDAPIPFRGFA